MPEGRGSNIEILFLMNILVTGGAGFIGSHTLIELYKAGHTAVVVDNLSNSNLVALQRVEEILSTPQLLTPNSQLLTPNSQLHFRFRKKQPRRTQRNHSGEDITYCSRQKRTEKGGGNEDETHRHHRHEKCRNERHPIVGDCFATTQINRDCPKREGGKQLVGP